MLSRAQMCAVVKATIQHVCLRTHLSRTHVETDSSSLLSVIFTQLGASTLSHAAQSQSQWSQTEAMARK